MFFGWAGDPLIRAALDRILDRDGLFDEERVRFVGIGRDSDNAAMARLAEEQRGRSFLPDVDGRISRSFGVMQAAGTADGAQPARHSLVLDPSLRVIARFGFDDPGHVEKLIDYLERLPPPDHFPGVSRWAPVLILPRLFEPALCSALVDLCEASFPADAPAIHDYLLADEGLRAEIAARIGRRLKPELEKAFQYSATRVERYLVRRYLPGPAPRAQPLRENAGRATAHRRFAVVTSLNAEEHQGGDLRFPEFGTRTYRAGTGGAVVFARSMPFEITPVTAGRRYALLQFVFDEAAERIRVENERGGVAAGGAAHPPAS